MMEAAAKLGGSLYSSSRAEEMMRNKGFVDVVRIPFIWPQNQWPQEKSKKELGKRVQQDFVTGLKAMSLALFTYGLGWPKDKIDVFLETVKIDILDERIHGYWPVDVVYGKKP